MTISPETIEKVRSSIDIVELVREYIPTVKRSGRNWKANCPFHNEKTPSLMISPEKGIFHCFGCGAGGDVFKFVMMIDSLSWPESIRKLASRCGVTIQETTEETVKRSEKQKLFDLLEQSARYYHRMLRESIAGRNAREYLKKRGVSEDSIEKFVLGYAPRGSLIEQAKKKGFTVEALSSAGVITRTERGTYFEYMSDRLVFPILDTQGRVVGFGGRTLKDDQPKYLNTPETVVYSKSSQLYGLFQALPTVRSSRALMVLEGYMDVVVTHQFGVSNTVATLGTSLTAQHAQMLPRYADDITLLFDSDEAGFAAAKRATDILIEKDLTLKISSLPDGVDPDEYLVAHGTEYFNALVEQNRQSAVEFLTAMALRKHGSGSPEAKARVVQELVPFLARSQNAVLVGEWIKYIAGQTATAETAIVSEVKRVARPSARSGVRQPAAARHETGIRSAEEELIQLISAFPQFVSKVDERIFCDARCKTVFELLTKQMTVGEIATRVQEPISQWFTELLLEEKSYTEPDEIFRTIVYDLEQTRKEMRRQELGRDIDLMTSKHKPLDEEIVRQYQELNKQLKGSVKSRHGKKE
jgi:DNA primase